MIKGMVMAQWIDGETGFMLAQVAWEDGGSSIDIVQCFVTEALYDSRTNFIWFR